MPVPRSVRTASPYVLALVLFAAGVNHFVNPAAYDRIVPRLLPAPRAITYASGVAEIGCALAVAWPRTRRVGGWLTAGLFVAVFPANVQMALDGGVLAWLRLPLQVPLIAWAIHVARRSDAPADRAARRIEPVV